MSDEGKGKTFIRRRGSTVVPNRTVYDKRLSYTALGVLLVLLARPSDAAQGYRALVGRGSGQKALLDALRELGEAGYRHQIRVREDGGKFATHTVVSELPMSPSEAHEWLKDTIHRAALYHARSDQRGHRVSAGGTVRDPPGPGAPGPGGAPHLPTEAKVLDLRSRTGDTKAPYKPANFDDMVARARREAESR